MRRVRSDVSHRIRRQPSIFSVRWFRIALGVGVALVVVLLVGPSVAGLFGGDLPRSLFLLLPWSGSDKTVQSRPAEPTTSQPTAPSPGPASSNPPPGGPAGAGGSPPRAPALPPPSRGARGAAGGSPTSPPPPTAPAPAPPSPSPSPSPPKTASSSTDAASAATSSLTVPPTVYW